MDDAGKFKILFAMALIVITIFLYWSIDLYLTSDDLILTPIIFLILIVLGMVILVKRYDDWRTSQPATDELSQKRAMMAGYYSFLISIYLWLVLMYISDYLDDPSILFGAGILGMAIIFALSNLVVRFRVIG